MNFPGIITVVSYSSTQPQALLSPAVWGKAAISDTVHGVLGVGAVTTFANGFIDLGTATDTNGVAATVSSFASTVIVPGDNIVQLNSGSTANTAAGLLHTTPLGPISPGGNSVWFETALQMSSSTNAQTLFAGLTVAKGLYTTPAGIFLTQSTLSTGLPLVGFYMTSTAPNNVSCVYQASTGGLQTVLANVLTASTANPNPGSLTASPVAAPGGFQVASTTANPSGRQSVKLGLQYNADANTLTYYVNGYAAASFQPTAGNFDVTDSFGGLVAIGGSAQTVFVDFLAAAAQLTK